MGKRRGANEGSVCQLKDGRWVAVINLGYVGTKRKRKYLYAKTRREVLEKLQAAQREQLLGVNLATERQTVAQFLTNWLEQVVKPSARPKTHHSYAQVVRLYLIPHLGHHQLTKLVPEHVQAMLNILLSSGGRAGQGLAPRTVHTVRAVLRRALGQAVKWGALHRNAAALVDAPRLERYKLTPLDEVQARALLQAVSGQRLEALYRVALSLGLRKGEVLGLQWLDVDWQGCTIRVARSLQRQGGKLVLAPTKTASSVRVLSLPTVLLVALRKHQAAQERERAIRSDEWQEHGLIFPSERGTPMEPRNLIRHFKKMLRWAGLPERVRFHDLRHSCATLMIAQGVHLSVIKEILGHSQIAVTADTYGHVLPDVQRDAAAKIDAVLGPLGASEGTIQRPPAA